MSIVASIVGAEKTLFVDCTSPRHVDISNLASRREQKNKIRMRSF